MHFSFLLCLLVHPCNPKHDHCPPPRHHDEGSGANNSANDNANAGATGNYGAGAGDGYDESKAKIVPGTAPFALIVAAAAAAVAAMAALAVAAKRRRKPEYHQLRGSVGQRMKLFSGFANRCFEDRAVSGAQNAASEVGLQVV